MVKIYVNTIAMLGVAFSIGSSVLAMEDLGESKYQPVSIPGSRDEGAMDSAGVSNELDSNELDVLGKIAALMQRIANHEISPEFAVKTLLNSRSSPGELAEQYARQIFSARIRPEFKVNTPQFNWDDMRKRMSMIQNTEPLSYWLSESAQTYLSQKYQGMAEDKNPYDKITFTEDSPGEVDEYIRAMRSKNVGEQLMLARECYKRLVKILVYDNKRLTGRVVSLFNAVINNTKASNNDKSEALYTLSSVYYYKYSYIFTGPMPLDTRSPAIAAYIKILTLEDSAYDASAAYQLGRIYSPSCGECAFYSGVTRNYEEARKYFERAAEKGHKDANFQLALMWRNRHIHSSQKYPNDFQESEVFQKARHYFTQAASKGEKVAGECKGNLKTTRKLAKYHHGHLLLFAAGNSERLKREGRNLIKASADLGYEDAIRETKRYY